jgi:hypothetical protein
MPGPREITLSQVRNRRKKSGLSALTPPLADAGLDMHLAGFEPAEIDALMGGLIDPQADPADELPDIDKRPIGRKGDLWLLGRHRLRTPYQRSAHES